MNLRLRQPFDYDPVKGSWTELGGQTPVPGGQCVVLDRTGTFAAVLLWEPAIKDVDVDAKLVQTLPKRTVIAIWDITTVPVLVREIETGTSTGSTPPDTASSGRGTATQPATPGHGQPVQVAWSSSGRRLLVIHITGIVCVCDLVTGAVTVVARIKELEGCKPSNTRAMFHPCDEDTVLVSHSVQLPFVLSLKDGSTRAVSSASVPKPPDDRRVVQCDAVFANGGKHVLLLSGKSSIQLLDAETLKPVLSRHIPSVLLTVPRLQTTRHDRWVLVTSRGGILVVDTTTLECVDQGYREGVDNTQLSLCTLSHDSATVVAAPGADANGARHNNCLFFFRTGIVGDIRIAPLPEPSECPTSLQWHPHLPLLFVCMTSGRVFALRRAYSNDWPGIMYPTGYSILLANREYQERETEFDDMDEEGTRLPKKPRRPDESGDVDVVTLADTMLLDPLSAATAADGAGDDVTKHEEEEEEEEGDGTKREEAGDGESDDDDGSREASVAAWQRVVRAAASLDGTAPPRASLSVPARDLTAHGPSGSGQLRWLPPHIPPRRKSVTKKRARASVWPMRTKKTT